MELLEAGRIVKISGLRGRVKVLSYLESNDIMQACEEVFIRREDRVEPFQVRGIRLKGNCFFLDVKGVDDLERAKGLVGCEVLIPWDTPAELPEDEYYWRDLIGLEVVTEDGHFVGKIETVFPTGSNDVYVCKGGEREILIPAITDVVRKVDMEHRKMVVRLLDGL